MDAILIGLSARQMDIFLKMTYSRDNHSLPMYEQCTEKSTLLKPIKMLSLKGMLLLALIGMNVTDASVKKFEDTTMQLIAPWTDAEHSLACPPQDPRPCPVLSMNAPVISVAVPPETLLI